MSAIAEMGAGLQAALLLARGRADGIVRLAAPADGELRGAARSFWAMALCLPAFVALHLLDWAQSGVPKHPAAHLAADLLSYVISWIAFAVISHALAARLDRARQWPRFITVWSWCNVAQYLMQTVAALPVLLGAPDWLVESTWLIAVGWALWLEWFATRLTLGVPSAVAASMTAFDLLLGLFLFGLAATIS